MEDKRARSPWVAAGFAVMFVITIASTVVATAAITRSQLVVQASTPSTTAGAEIQATDVPPFSPNTTDDGVWEPAVSTTTTIPAPPVATNFTVETVEYPLLESPDITNPPSEDPDMQIRFSSGTVPEGPQELDWICPLEFEGSSKLCIQTFTFTDSDDPYRGSVILEIRPGAGSCKDFADCFELLRESSYCETFLDYLDMISRELATNGYNSFGLNNLDPSKMNLSYWDGKGDNRQLIFNSDCTVDVEQR